MNNLDNRTEKRKLGDIGENCACEYLRRHGFKIIERNYLRKWGEIDIVAQKGPILHFVEVKSVRLLPTIREGGQVSCDTSKADGSHGTSEAYRPEDNLHPGKLKRLHRTIELYLLHEKHAGDWQLDLITAKIDLKTRQAKVEMLENIVI